MPLGTALQQGRATLDAFAVSFLGIPPDRLAADVLEYLPTGSAWRWRGPNRGTVHVPDENPVLCMVQPRYGTVSLSVMGPLAGRLQAFAWGQAQAYMHEPTGNPKWQLRARVSRVDACLDVDRPGAWESISAALDQVRDEFPELRHEFRGDPARPDLGWTRYLGSRESVLLRVYEKGKQLRSKGLSAEASPDWVRVEVEVHPEDAAAFAALTATPEDVIRHSRPALRLLALLGIEGGDFVRSRNGGYRSQLWRALALGASQYRRHFVELCRRTGGDAEAAARALAAILLHVSPTPEDAQRVVERGVASAELQGMVRAVLGDPGC